MSASFAIAVADAVVTELNRRIWSILFYAERKILTEKEIKSLEIPSVTVVPRNQEFSISSRKCIQQKVVIDIGIQKHLSGDFDAEVPVYIALVDEFVRHFVGRWLDSPPVVCTGAANDPIYSVEHLREMSILTTVASLTFEGNNIMAEALLRS